MAKVTKTIGLSLGADICWPICFENIVQRLDLKLEEGENQTDFKVERVSIEPFDLRQPCKYSVVLDRLTHWYHTSREWIKKAIVLNDLYVLNNPWAVQSMEKHTSYCAMMRLGMPIPETWMIPPKEYEKTADLDRTLKSYARLFDLGEVGKALGYPLFMKPYDGGGWRGVSMIKDEPALRAAYEESGKNVMHLQKAVDPYEQFVRCIGLGPQFNLVSYNPDAPLHARYIPGPATISDDEAVLLRKITKVINAFFVWDFNSCEALLQRGTWYPIDFANPCPDSQVTSLHWHFPWMVLANVRWAIFCAATGRKVRMNHNWAPYFAIADNPDLSFPEKLDGYVKLADEHFETEKFEAFCAKHLTHLEEVALEFFSTDIAKDAVKKKVAALFPAHEIEVFTEYFWTKIQDWRAWQAKQG